MKIDNSQMVAFNFCGRKWEERYANNLEPRGERPALNFGTRMHQLLEERYIRGMSFEPKPSFAPLDDTTLESEVQLTFAAYEAHYPTEPFDVVSVEEYFEVGLPCSDCGEYPCRYQCPNDHLAQGNHTYCGEFDAIVRMRESGKLRLLETKTEQRQSKSNSVLAWQQRTQVGLYLWAAEQIYGEEFEGIILNIITRQSPAGREPPTFRRDNLERTRGQRHEAVSNLVWVADQIEACQRTGFFPANRNECVSRYGWSCEFLPLHQAEGRPNEELIQLRFQEARPYLSGL